MERKLILDLITGVLAVMVITFLWAGLFVCRKRIDWNDYEGVGYVFVCLTVGVVTLALIVNAWFWFTEHIIYIP